MNNSQCRCVICHDYGDRAEMAAADRRLIDNVGAHGWGVLGIPADGTHGSWAFTVGLWHSYRSPEIAIYGLQPDRATALLNLVGDQIAAGAAPAAGDHIDNVFATGDYRMRLGPVAEPWRPTFFGITMWFYRSSNWAVLQCLWPDKAGRFPDEEGFAAELDRWQPRLDLPPDEHPAGMWTACYKDYTH